MMLELFDRVRSFPMRCRRGFGATSDERDWRRENRVGGSRDERSRNVRKERVKEVRGREGQTA